MRRTMMACGTLAALAAVAMLGSPGTSAQEIVPKALPKAAPHAGMHHMAHASHVVIPQSRAWSMRDRNAPVAITGVSAGVVILQQVATTTLDVSLANPGAAIAEAVVLLPVPEGAIVRGFDFEGAGKEPSAKLLPKAEAKATYDGIVAKLRDPALLEFAGYNFIKSSVFPVPARGTQKVRITYEHVLPADGRRIDYVLPRSESFESAATPWTISVRIKSKQPVATVYSPSHAIEFTRSSDNLQASVNLSTSAQREPGPFRLSWLVEAGAVSASLFAYPDPKIGGGYFLLIAGLPNKPKSDGENAPQKREVILVVDTSGSMTGEKLAQAKAAALQVVEGLDKGEAFNIIDYNSGVSTFAEKPVIKTEETLEAARKYIRNLTVEGGTNIHDALVEALRTKPTAGMLPIVLFLTDGIATIGVKDEVSIRKAAEKMNVHNRRIFTFGVGYDVNTPLLSALARQSRAISTFVGPRENVEEKVSQVYRRLAGPMLSEPSLHIIAADGTVDTRTVRDLQPNRLNDLFDGDQLVVLGRYKGEGKIRFRLDGKWLGNTRAFEFEFDLDKATVRNAFVPRLWASRKIAVLVDAIRDSGVDPVKAAADPKLKELVDEIVRLSTEFGVLTEYTSFLALEGTDLSKKDAILAEASKNFYGRAVGSRSGVSSANQDNNINYQRAQVCENRRNGYWDANMQRVEVTTVQQVCDRAMFRRGNRWVDSTYLNKGAAAKADRTVEFGTAEFDALVERLAADGRQGLLALSSETMITIDGQSILVKMPAE